mmetsp:Transcript_86800/g.165950  ORF Transcript_86800/g.165950 Transcript_86800/m.165950 type:complete len:96 (-) Transcript_86800:5-292(-)
MVNHNQTDTEDSSDIQVWVPRLGHSDEQRVILVSGHCSARDKRRLLRGAALLILFLLLANSHHEICTGPSKDTLQGWKIYRCRGLHYTGIGTNEP